MTSSNRTIFIGVLSLVGGTLVGQGAGRDMPNMILGGLLLLSFALGIIVSGHRAAVIMREHSRAMWRAGWISYLLRRWL
jgi:hypothetical protein